MLQLTRGLANLDGRFVNQRQHGAELHVEGCKAANSLQCAADGRMSAAFFVFVQLQQRCLRSFGKASAIGQASALFVESAHLTIGELQRIELAHLIAQQLEASVPVARQALELDHPIELAEPDAVRDLHLAHHRIVTPEVIDELALRGAARQRLEFVLAMDIDEDRPELAQQLHRHDLPVEVGARAAIRSDDPPDGQLQLRTDRLLLEPALQLPWCAHQIERS